MATIPEIKKVEGALTDTWQTPAAIALAAGVPEPATRQALESLKTIKAMKKADADLWKRKKAA